MNLLQAYEALNRITEGSAAHINSESLNTSRKFISENANKNGGFRTDGYRTALACYDSDDFDINVELGLQDEDEYEVEGQLYLLKPGQTVADLVVYLSYECGYTNIYVYGETSANRDEIKTATRFTTVPGNHDYTDYGTIETRLVEEMEEDEDTVECTWCEEVFDRSECRKEVNLGWLCSRCEAAIKSRGETLTFKENNYWDFLDEAAAIQDSTMIGKYVQLVNINPKYQAVGSPYSLFELKSLLKDSKGCKLSKTEIDFIAKFDNKCKIIQETEKGYLVTIPYYCRDRQDRSKFEERPRYTECWVPKSNTKLIKTDLSEA